MSLSSWFSRGVSVFRAIGDAATLWMWLSSPMVALYILGPVLVAWGFIAGWFEGVPTPYLVLSSVLIFGAVGWSMLQVSIWRERNRVKDKLYFRDVTVGVSSSELNDQLTLVSAQIGILLESTADFPIDFIVDEMSSDMDARINPNPGYHTKEGTVLKGRPSYYRDAPISMSKPVKEIKFLTGKIRFKIRYGRDKNYRYQLEHVIKVDLTPNKDRPGQYWVNWSYVEHGQSKT